MREIEGIDAAMEVLKPYWKDIEEDFHRHNDRFLELAATDHDFIGRVLRAHLVVENFLNSYLEQTFGFDDFDGLRLTFAQKAKMLPSAKVSAAFVRPGIIQLNKVRNKFGHTLSHVIEFGEINAMTDILSIARPNTTFEQPIEAIEAFAPIACAFLSNPPMHLQNVFVEAFKSIQTASLD
ncbi:hypothetical protein [Labrenzia sp. CE80]|uniref:hypothetical protein n=1 Tax=Labrenzia sp. CE80 TaxID=1788986 RepID=UPI00129ACDCA|nr:hypothetical protein [Labrenzia sp. CE80]